MDKNDKGPGGCGLGGWIVLILIFGAMITWALIGLNALCVWFPHLPIICW